MAIAFTAQQKCLFAQALADQQLAAQSSLSKVFVVGDSPNAGRTVETVYGRGSRPDLRQAVQVAREFGCVYKAVMVANPGLPQRIVRHYGSCGFEVDLGRAPDCDDRYVRRCAEAAVIADVLICIGGDHAPIDVLRLAKGARRKIRVIVMSVKQRTHISLLETCDRFIELPVIRGSLAAA